MNDANSLGATAQARQLRELHAKATEPRPKPLPEQDSRVGEAMAGKADMHNLAQWNWRVTKAKDAIVAALPQFLETLGGMHEQAAQIAEHYGRCFGEKPPGGERGTNIVWVTAHAIAYRIRCDSGGTISAASPETTLSDPSEGDMK